jgi:putative addiction module component (TIGR02574 family)
VTSEARKLLETALALPEDERAALVEALSDSFEFEPAELSPERRVEVGDRIAALEQGDVEAIPWSDVEARIRRTLGASA